jgi:outer membrane protein assembly factor BamB
MTPPRRRALLLLAAIAFLTTGPVVAGVGDARSAQPAPASVLASADYPALRWQFETRAQITDAPLVAGDVLLQQSEDGYLYALDLETGAERWRAETGHAAFARAHVNADDERAYISDQRGRLRAIDVATGETLWRRQTAPPVDHTLDHIRSWVPQDLTEELVYTPVFPPAGG